MRKSLYEYCIENEKEEIISQWHQELNEPLSPQLISYGSKKKVWWRCDKGHEWNAIVKSRTSGTGCPVCTRRIAVTGENDLATTHPDLACQWHPTKNRACMPQDVVAGTRRKAWWICDKGHEWEATVASRTSNGNGCPVCAGKSVISGENDLSSMYPDIGIEWHPTKNAPLTPQMVTAYSNRKAWWVCSLGHEYFAIIAHRTEQGSGCPYCSGRKVLKGFNDLATLDPELAKQWHLDLNGELTPDQVTRASHKRIWWQCQDDHVWRAVIYSRALKKKGCPVCAGAIRKDRQKRYQRIMEDIV